MFWWRRAVRWIVICFTWENAAITMSCIRFGYFYIRRPILARRRLEKRLTPSEWIRDAGKNKWENHKATFKVEKCMASICSEENPKKNNIDVDMRLLSYLYSVCKIHSCVTHVRGYAFHCLVFSWKSEPGTPVEKWYAMECLSVLAKLADSATCIHTTQSFTMSWKQMKLQTFR